MHSHGPGPFSLRSNLSKEKEQGEDRQTGHRHSCEVVNKPWLPGFLSLSGSCQDVAYRRDHALSKGGSLHVGKESLSLVEGGPFREVGKAEDHCLGLSVDTNEGQAQGPEWR